MDAESDVLTDSLEDNTLRACSQTFISDPQRSVMELAAKQPKQLSAEYDFSDGELSLASGCGKRTDPSEGLEQAQIPFIPPLELTSCSSSVITDAEDPFKGVLDIDLRYDSEHDCTPSTGSRSSEAKDNTISSRWNVFSEELKQRQKQSEQLTKVSKARVANQTASIPYDGGLIYVGDRMIGRQVRPETRYMDTVNFVQANKTKIACRKHKSLGSYSAIYQGGKSTEISKSPLPSLRGEHGSNHLFNQRMQMQNAAYSAPTLLGRATPRNVARKLSKTDGHTDEDGSVNQCDNLNRFKSIIHHNRPSVEQKSNQIQTREVYIQSGSPTDLRYNSTGHINSSTYPTTPLGTGSHAHPLSASGVYRKGLQQQAELIKAHQQFYQNRTQRLVGDRLTRLDKLCQKVTPSETVISRHPSPHLREQPHMHSVEPFDSHVKHHRSITAQFSESPHCQITMKRYTMKDYTLLPRIPVQSTGLGPDLDSAEYKARLNKYQRQHGYAELLRMRASKQHDRRSRNPVRPRINDVVEHGVRSESAHCRSEKSPVELSSPSMETRNPPSGKEPGFIVVQESESARSSARNQSERQSGLAEVKFRSKSLERTTMATDKLSEREAEKQKIIQKRELMKQYAENIRFKLSKQRAKAKNRATHNSPLASKQEQANLLQNSSISSIILDSTDEPQLLEMLRRHEEDRKLADALWKVIGVSP
ncbi:hypothetical protein X801_02942 [Opisthorchis viverrini]|uniref:Uncharacterized protein n=1 Tax=Opisthorchis viverrini TaxID=6198 RepID=A0A1S8X391_OPIVI|nr:hypothetical protein X801_02942 [Opisthorchis viverrini]